MTERKPFHETIVGAIKRCPAPSNGEIFRLFRLIKETEIPKGHDKIIAAIDEYFYFPGAGKYTRAISEVKNSILEQKKNEEEKRMMMVTSVSGETFNDPIIGMGEFPRL